MLVGAAAGGPTGAGLFNQVGAAIETACLLASSYTCGLMSLAVNSRRRAATYFFAAVTFVLGAAFLSLEIREFTDMIAREHEDVCTRPSAAIIAADTLGATGPGKDDAGAYDADADLAGAPDRSRRRPP